MDFDLAAELGVAVLRKLLPLETGDVMNVNLPPLSRGRPKHMRVVPQATSGFNEYYIPHGDGTSEIAYQLAGGSHRREAGPTDTTALSEGYITITPLLADMTDHKKTVPLQSKLDGAVG
jgi:5'-nucleotidase